MTYETDSRRKNSNTTINPQLYMLIKSIALNKQCYINSLIEEGLLHVIEKNKNFIPSDLYKEELDVYEELKKSKRKK